MNTENYTKVRMEQEFLMIYDDRIVISWYDGFDDSITDFKTKPRQHRIGFIGYPLFIVIIFVLSRYFLFPKEVLLPQTGVCLVMWLYQYVFLSDATVIERNKIKKVTVNKVRVSIIFKGKMIWKKREIILPHYRQDEAIALQLLKENKLINNELKIKK